VVTAQGEAVLRSSRRKCRRAIPTWRLAHELRWWNSTTCSARYPCWSSNFY